VSARPARWKILSAFVAVYLIWGSTYLAIHWALESIPVLLLGGTRFLLAGGAMVAWAVLRGDARVSRRQLFTALLTGGMMLFVSNTCVVWSVARAPSGLVALVVGSVPLWITIFTGLGAGPRPTPATWLGVVIGMLGLALLVGPGAVKGGHGVDPLAALVLTVGCMSWAGASVLSRKLESAPSPAMATGLQMLSGGVLVTLVGLAVGEGARFHLADLTWRAGLSQLYLVTFGSIIGFTAYVWLLRVVSPTLAGTYAFVNPVVAVLLGLLFNGESLSTRTLLAGALIVVAVVIITFGPRPAPRAGESR
jgi:drug/metabolite transporter (DMT)-like permease